MADLIPEEKREEMKMFYENHWSSKDKDICKDMEKRYGIGRATFFRFKKLYGWTNHVKEAQRKEREKANRKKSKTKTERGQAKKENVIAGGVLSMGVESLAQKAETPKRRKKILPDQDRVDKLSRNVDKSTAEEELLRLRVEQVKEMLVQGARPAEIRLWVETKAKDGNPLWQTYDIGNLATIIYASRDNMVLTTSLDLDLEAAKTLERCEFLFSKCIQSKDYATALKVHVTKLALIRDIFGGIRQPGSQSKPIEQMSDQELLAEIKKIDNELKSTDATSHQ